MKIICKETNIAIKTIGDKIKIYVAKNYRVPVCTIEVEDIKIASNITMLNHFTKFLSDVEGIKIKYNNLQNDDDMLNKSIKRVSSTMQAEKALLAIIDRAVDKVDHDLLLTACNLFNTIYCEEDYVWDFTTKKLSQFLDETYTID